MKNILVVVMLIAGTALVFAGGQGEEQATDATTRPTQIVIEGPGDVQPAVGPNGSWIIIFTEDVTVESQVVIGGEVYEEEGAEAPRRKLALYAQDADRNVTARYTLTVPKLVVRHVNTRIQAGNVVGDVYVEAEGFELTSGATIDGNLYFATEALRESANIEDATVTGDIAIGSL